MIVSALKKTSPDRILVEFEGGESLRSTLAAVTDARLYVGMELRDDEFAALRRSSRRGLERLKALELLSRRPHSRKELKDKLLRRGIDEEDAEDCVSWLAEHGFLDDGEYAGAVARHYAAKGYGAGRVRSELQRRGIDRELAADTLSDLPDNSGKIDAFLARRLHDPSDREAVRKVSAALFRRGFSWEEIRGALHRFDSSIEEE